MVVFAEYIWLDGTEPTAQLRSKTRILHVDAVKGLRDLPEWGFDGSSTNQAPGDKSDCALKPVYYCRDPIRGPPHILVMCEVFLASGEPHPSNTRALLRPVAAKTKDQDPWFGIEQEYTLYNGTTPLGFPASGAYPGPQGPYYCGVGADLIHGRPLVEEHMKACADAGITHAGINAEVMPGQWEFQCGPLGALEVADQLWVSRWLLQRLGEKHGVTVSWAPKPVRGDWNGAGAHTNFSTKTMRSPGGIKVIEQAVKALEKNHDAHIAEYGAGNEDRLTGRHETARIDEFRWGYGDRGASVRINALVAKTGMGYLEDRRPAANMDPYRVTRKLLETVCLNGKGAVSANGARKAVVRATH